MLVFIAGFAYFITRENPQLPAVTAWQSSSELVPVDYHVTGTADGADLTITGTGGGTEQRSGVGVPLKDKTTHEPAPITVSMHHGDFVFLSAQTRVRAARSSARSASKAWSSRPSSPRA